MPDSPFDSIPLGTAQEFVDNAPCGFLSFSDNGSVVLVNEPLLSLLGYDRSEIEHGHIERILSVGGRIFYQTHFFPLLRLRGAVEEIYLALRAKSGEEFPVLVNASRQLHGERYLNHCVMLPMRERRKFEDELIAARKQVMDAAKMKDEFLAMVSHELRTPLSAVSGWLQILKQSIDDPELVREALEVIERNAAIQTRLIDDLLDFSRITSGKLRLEVASVDLANVVRSALDVVRPAANAKEIVLSSVIDPNVGTIIGDANRLQQVMWNLLSNAIKFTPNQGRIMIELERMPTDVRLVVQDSGIGIDPEFLPFVFERFRQEESGRTRGHRGLGLGLAITKEIVELHGGTIRVKSAGPGTGSAFEVHLPVPSGASLITTAVTGLLSTTRPARSALRSADVSKLLRLLQIYAHILSGPKRKSELK